MYGFWGLGVGLEAACSLVAEMVYPVWGHGLGFGVIGPFFPRMQSLELEVRV